MIYTPNIIIFEEVEGKNKVDAVRVVFFNRARALSLPCLGNCHLAESHLGNWWRVAELADATERGSRDCDLDGIFRLLISRFNIKPFRELAFREPRLG